MPYGGLIVIMSYSNIPLAIPPTTIYLMTEDDQFILTEAGDRIEIE